MKKRHFFLWCDSPYWGLLIIEASRSHSFRRTTLGRISPDEWLAQRKHLYLPTNHMHKTQTF